MRSQSNGDCVIECDDTVNGTAVFSCFTFSDGANSVLKKAGLAPSTCVTNTIEAPEEAGVSDPEMVTITCPEYFMWSGWDSTVKRTMGSMRQMLLLKSDAVVKAIADGFTHGVW